MLALAIARRFLWRSKLQSALIVAGIGVGIGTQVFVGSLIASLQDSLIDSTVGASAHVTLLAAEEGERLRLGDAVAARLTEDDRVTAVVPQQRLPMLARTGDESAPLVVRLADAETRDTIYGLDGRLTAGRADPGAGELLVGLDFADEAGIGVGDALTLVTDAGDEIDVTVAGIFDLGVAAVNLGTAFGAPDLAPDVLDLPADAYDLVELQVADVFASSAVAADLERLDGVATTDWQAENADLLSALRSQSVSSTMIQVFVVVAVALGIASTLAIAAVQKTRQIGILKAMGLTNRRSGAVFVWQAGLLGAAGTILGLLIGWGLIVAFDRASTGSEELFPVSVDPFFAAISGLVGLGIAFLSALIPYRSTSRLDPIAVIQGG